LIFRNPSGEQCVLHRRRHGKMKLVELVDNSEPIQQWAAKAGRA
jgi:hypothetical protein